MQIICTDCELDDLKCPEKVFRGDTSSQHSMNNSSLSTTTDHNANISNCQSGIWSYIDINVNIFSIAFAFVMINHLSRCSCLILIATITATLAGYVEGIYYCQIEVHYIQ